MGVIDVIAQYWPAIVALGALGGVCAAFARCAIAEAAIRLAAHLYTSDSVDRTRWREEWLRTIDDMNPAERPAHAGSLLWVGVREAATRQLRSRTGRVLMLSLQEVGAHTQIRATCDECGDIELTPKDILVRGAVDASAGTYEFECPRCAERVVRPTDAETIDLLVSANVQARDLSGDEWPFPDLASRVATPRRRSRSVRPLSRLFRTTYESGFESGARRPGG